MKSLYCPKELQDGRFCYQNSTSYTYLKRQSKDVLADFLVERANEEYEPMSFDFPNEDLMAVLQIKEDESPKEDR